jgi:hypothetical protein
VKKETYSRNKAEFEDSTDELVDDSDTGLYEPKHSPMRRKEKFRSKDFREEKKHKDRKRDARHKMKHDFEY